MRGSTHAPSLLEGYTMKRANTLKTLSLISMEDVPLSIDDLRLTSAALGSAQRSGGYHVSAGLRRIARSMGVLSYDEDEAGVSSAPSVGAVRMAIGHAWETWYAALLSARDPLYVQWPGELRLDDVAGTPDGLLYDGSVADSGLPTYRIIDIKTTVKAAYNDPTDHMSWWMARRQIMAYAWMAKKTKPEWGEVSAISELHVLHLVGDRSKGCGSPPGIVRYIMKMDWSEVEACWPSVVVNAVEAGREDGGADEGANEGANKEANEG